MNNTLRLSSSEAQLDSSTVNEIRRRYQEPNFDLTSKVHRFTMYCFYTYPTRVTTEPGVKKGWGQLTGHETKGDWD